MKGREIFELIGGIGAGAVMMYLLDPEMGKKRRRQLKSRAGHAIEETGEYLGDAWHSFGRQAQQVGQDIKDYYGHYRDEAAKRARYAGESLVDYGRSYAGEARSYAKDFPKRAGILGEDVAKQASGYPVGMLGNLGHRFSDLGHKMSSAAHGLFNRGRLSRSSHRNYGRSYFPMLHHHKAHEQSSTAMLLGTAVACALIGAGVMYIFDPDRGRRRRALMRDKMIRAGHATSEYARDTGQYLSDRARGLAHEAKSHIYEEPVDDDRLVHRVRAELGRAVAHPGSIHVAAHEGRVTLVGPILRSEVDELIARVESIRGVKGVENHLNVHDSPGNIPGLQGVTDRPQPMM